MDCIIRINRITPLVTRMAMGGQQIWCESDAGDCGQQPLTGGGENRGAPGTQLGQSSEQTTYSFVCPNLWRDYKSARAIWIILSSQPNWSCSRTGRVPASNQIKEQLILPSTCCGRWGKGVWCFIPLNCNHSLRPLLTSGSLPWEKPVEHLQKLTAISWQQWLNGWFRILCCLLEV